MKLAENSTKISSKCFGKLIKDINLVQNNMTDRCKLNNFSFLRGIFYWLIDFDIKIKSSVWNILDNFYKRNKFLRSSTDDQAICKKILKKL